MAKNVKKNHRTSSLSRPQGTRVVKQSFLIVCEGMCTEPDYFRAFRMTTATIKAVGQGMNTISLVNKAISIRDTDIKKKRIYDQCWVVFDKDDFPASDFNQAIALAERNGFRVAYSNQAFEYWFLLHFNLAKAACKRIGITYSISSCKSFIHNAYMPERFICVVGINPGPQVIDKLFKELILFTARAA